MNVRSLRGAKGKGNYERERALRKEDAALGMPGLRRRPPQRHDDEQWGKTRLSKITSM